MSEALIHKQEGRSAGVDISVEKETRLSVLTAGDLPREVLPSLHSNLFNEQKPYESTTVELRVDVPLPSHEEPIKSKDIVKKNVFEQVQSELVAYGNTAKQAWEEGTPTERTGIVIGGLLTLSGIILSLPVIHTVATGVVATSLMFTLALPLAFSVPVYIVCSLSMGLGLIVSGMLVTKHFAPESFKDHTFKIGKNIVEGALNGAKKVGGLFSKKEQTVTA